MLADAAELAGVLADQAALAVVDGVRPAAAQRPAVVGREDRRRVHRPPRRDGLDQAAAGADHADRARFLGEELPRHRLDDAIGFLDAAAGAQQVAHLAEQGDLAAPLLELGDPAGQPPVRLLQRRLGLLALGDVLEHRDGEARVPLRIADHRRGERDPDRLAVAAHDAALGAVVLDAAVGQLAPVALRLLALVLVDEVGDDAAAQLLELIAEHLDDGAVGVGDAPAGSSRRMPTSADSKTARKRSSLSTSACSARRRSVTSRKLTTTAATSASASRLTPTASRWRNSPSRCRQR